MSTLADVLVVGAGPAGCATAVALSDAGHDVVLVDRASGPVDKPCGELVPPPAVARLESLLGERTAALPGFHRITHVRFTTTPVGSAERSTSVRWPSDGRAADVAVVAPRPLLACALVDRARRAGVDVRFELEATEPIVARGFVRGAHVVGADGSPSELRAAYTVVADGANSRFGRALGTYREPTWPFALAHRAIHHSPLHDAAEVEFVLDLTDRAGTPITGLGWMFPRGDGTVNVGVYMLSTSPSFRVIDPAHLLERLVDANADRWQLGEAVGVAGGGRIPLGNSVGPAAGPTYLVVGDAAGAANPLSGAGLGAALETGQFAADVLGEALGAGSAATLQRYPKLLDDRYGAYYKVGRLTDRMLGRPTVVRRLAGVVSSRATVATAVVRISGELMRRRRGVAELAYDVGRAISAIAPDA